MANDRDTGSGKGENTPQYSENYGSGSYGSGGGGGGGGGEEGPTQAEQIQKMLEDIFGGKRFNSIQKQLLSADFGVNDVGGLANEFRSIGMGGPDPRFANYQQGQFDVLRANELGQLGQTADFFTRRGGGNSTAALNALNRVSGGFDTQRQALSGQIGMQQLQRQDQSLLNSGNLFATRGNLLGQQLDSRQAALQNMLGQPELLIALMAAQNQGKDGGDGGGNSLLEKMIEDILG